MSCSWQDYYTVDNNKLKIEYPLCDKNIPIILKLAPSESKSVELKLLISQTMDASSIDFKVGFHLVYDQVFIDNFDFEQKFNNSILWSNTISM